MKTLLLSTFIILSILSIGQTIDKFEPFNGSDYPNEKYQITSDSIIFNDLLIEILQVRNKSGYDPFKCRAWLTIDNKSKPIYQRYFKSINAVGYCYGLFIPYDQPRQDYFIFSKLGDYDGRIFIVDSIGNVVEKIGGEFYISKDKRYLFSTYASDGSGLTVFDFIKGKCLFSENIEPYLSGWYFQDNKFISPIYDDKIRDNSKKYVIFDLVTNKLIVPTSNNLIPNNDHKLSIYNYGNSRNACNCGLEFLQRQK